MRFLILLIFYSMQWNSVRVISLIAPIIVSCRCLRTSIRRQRRRRQQQFGHVPNLLLLPLSAPAADPTLLFSSSSPSDVRRLSDWIFGEPLESLIPKGEAIAICRELLSDQTLIDDVEQALIENWDKLVQKLIITEEDEEVAGTGNNRKRSKPNTLSQLLGDDATQRLLRSVKNLDYDSKSVKTFLESDAVNDLFAQTLCR